MGKKKSSFKQKFPSFHYHAKALWLESPCLPPIPHPRTPKWIQFLNYQAQKTVALHTHLILPDLTNSKNLISRTPVSPAELLSLIIILGFFKDIHTFLFVSTFFFLRNIIMALKHLFIMLGGKKVSPTTKGKPSLHLPRGGPCVMRMSMPSGMRFHLSSRDWPLGRLKPHPLNHGVLWGDNAHGIRPAKPRFCPAIFLSRTFPHGLHGSLFSFWWLALAAGSFFVVCFKTNPSESQCGACELFN